nr:hypothetical protein [Tanacetum cinerariifolium]
MALPEDHLEKFHKMADAKEMWEAIKSRFGGNDESKKMQKYLLKQQFEGLRSFTRGQSESYSLILRIQLVLIRPKWNASITIKCGILLESAELKGIKTAEEEMVLTMRYNLVLKHVQNLMLDLKKLYDEQRDKLGDASVEITTYTLALKKVEAQLLCHQQNQLAYEQKIRFMKIDLDDKTNVLAYHKKLLLEALKENEDLKTKFDNWQNSSKNLNRLLNTQMSANDKFGLGYGDYRYGSILSYENEVLQSVFMNKESNLEDTHVNDRYAEGMHAVSPPMTRNYMPFGPDVEIDYSEFTYGPKQTLVDESDAKTYENASCESDSSVETTTSMPAPVDNALKIACEPKVWTDAPIIEEYESDSNDVSVSNVQENIEKPSFAFIDSIKHVKSPMENIKETGIHNHCPKVVKMDRNGHTKKGLGYAFTRKTCFVCGSFSHLIRDCDFHEKRMAKQAALTKNKNKVTGQKENRQVWTSVQRVNHLNKFVPSLLLTKTGKFPVNTARQNFSRQAASISTASKVNTARPFVNETRPKIYFYKSHLPNKRPFHNKTAQRTTSSYHKVNTINTSLSAVKKNRDAAVKASAGCSNGKITGKEKIKAGRLDFEDVYYVEELKHYNLFSMSQICDKKNKVLFTDTDCLVLSLDFKLPDKNKYFLKFLDNTILENQANKSAGPKKANNSAGTQANDDQGANTKEINLHDEHFVLPIWSAYSTTEELEKLKRQEKEAHVAVRKETTHENHNANTNNTILLNVVSIPISTAGHSIVLNDGKPSYPDDPSMPHLEDIYANPSEGIFTDSSYDDEGVVTDFNNLETTVTVSPTPTTRIHTIHPKTQILRDPISAVQTRSKVHKNFEAHALFQIKKVWILVDLAFKKKAVRTKLVYRNKKDKRGVVVINKAHLVAQGHRQEEGIDYDEVFAHVAMIEAIRIFLVFASYMGFIVYQMDAIYGLHQAPRAWYATLSAFLEKSGYRRGAIDKTLFIKQDKNVKTVSTPIETQKPLVKDEEAVDVDVHLYRSMIGSLMYLTASRPDIMFAVYACSRFQVTTKTSHLQAVKRIFRYLKDKPKLGLWYPKVSSFDLEAYSDSDYAGANLDRKSTTEATFVKGRLLEVNTANHRKKLVVTEDNIRHDLRLDDADGVECLPTEDIFIELACMGYEKPPPKLTFYKAFFSAQWKFLIYTLVQCMSAKRTSWNEFSCSVASAVICLATDLVTNQVNDLSSHKTKYTSPALTQKAAVEEEDEEDEVLAASTLPSPTHEPTPPLQEPITSPPQAQYVSPPPSPPQAQPAPPSSPPQEQPTTTSTYDMTLLNTLLETCTTLSHKVFTLEPDKVAQALEIYKLKRRVKGCIQIGGRIKAIDADEDITLVDMETEVDLGAELQGRLEEKDEVNAAELTVFDDEEVTMTMAQTLIKMKAKKSRILDEQMAKRLHDEEVEQAATREKKYQSLKRKPISVAPTKKNMIVYLKNMTGYKMAHFKGMTYDQVRPIFKREYNKVQTFFKTDRDEEPTKKRVAKETLLQESFKKLRTEVEVSGFESTQDTTTDDPKEMSEEDVKNMLQIVLVSEFKVEALQVKAQRLFEPDADDVIWKLQRYMHYPIIWKLYSNYERLGDKNLHECQSTKEQECGYILQVIKKLELKKLDDLLEDDDRIFTLDEPFEEMSSEAIEVPSLKDEEFAQIVVLGLCVFFPNGEALAQQLEPKMYDGSVIQKTDAIVIHDSEETLMLEDESRSKMLQKQKDPLMSEKKVITKPVDYAALNQLSKDFKTRFVPQTELSAKHVFWSKYLVNYEEPNLSLSTTIVEVPKELPKVSMVNSSLKKLKLHLASFDVVVKERTTATTITEGTWGFEHTKACFRDEIIPFVKALKDLFTSFDQFLIDELTEVQNVFNQIE